MKKITRATFKKFIRDNSGKLFLRVESSFNSMIDMVDEVKGSFSLIKPTPTNTQEKYNLGISGLWLVGRSADYFSHFENDQYVGIEYYNCCGSGKLAIKKTI